MRRAAQRNLSGALPSHWDGVVVKALLVTYLVCLAWIVFSPAEDAGRVTGIVAGFANFLEHFGLDADPSYRVLEFCANVLLFVPFGLLFSRILPAAHLTTIVSIGLSTSCVIELIQLTLPSRYATISDVLANTLGTVWGATLWFWVRRARKQGG